VALGTTEDAKKKRYDAEAVKAVLKGVEVIVSMKGKRVVKLDLKKEKVAEADIHTAILGPFGTLRAPALRKGNTLIVGFNEDEYQKLFK
jgi:arsenate reductase-like glutaredoxin family protein